MQIDSKDRILVAAKKELLAWGRAGLRIDRVAKEAAINKRMIYHYYGDREGLIAAALNHYVQTLLSAGLSGPLKALLEVFYPQSNPLSDNLLRDDATDTPSVHKVAPDQLEAASAKRPVLEEAMRVIATDVLLRGTLQECKHLLTRQEQRLLAEEILGLVLPGVFQQRRKPVYRIPGTTQPG